MKPIKAINPLGKFLGLRTRTKIFMGFLWIIALVMALVAIAVTRIVAVRNDYVTVIKHPLTLRSTLWEFQTNFLKLRRMTVMLAAYAGDNAEKHDYLVNECAEIYKVSVDALERAKNIVATNPGLTRKEKAVRRANADIMRGFLRRYHDDVYLSVERTARKGDRETALEIVESADVTTLEAQEKLKEMLDSAIETADTQARRAEAAAGRTITLLIVISIAIALFSVASALYMARQITRPLGPLTNFMRGAAATGNIAFRDKDAEIIEESARTRDELGQAIAAASAFIRRVSDIGGSLERVAAGDLTVELPLLSDHDTMGLAIRNMTGSLNIMFGEVESTSVQVAAGAAQVAKSAQTIALGASEQATSIEELSTSVSEVAEGMRNNAEIAAKAVALAGSIKGDAEKGSRHMNEMMLAVRQINSASQSIGKVMKVINEIAFQTNILSLNAAVEAARAGRHGQGFAVVAGEVRRLAAKSAEAARSTERLVADSMEKAEQGVRMAEETFTGLAEIVAGINESGRLVSGIANSFREQSFNIEQINSGIGQVSEVVQHNSATAEENASAAEEISRQSDMLRDLVARFKLRRDRFAPPRDTHTETEREFLETSVPFDKWLVG